MHDLLASEAQDVRAAEAVAVFCYQVRKCIGAFAAALGGLDTLVFAGASGRTPPRSARGFATGWDFLASNWTSNAMRSTNVDFIGHRPCQGAGHPHR